MLLFAIRFRYTGIVIVRTRRGNTDWSSVCLRPVCCSPGGGSLMNLFLLHFIPSRLAFLCALTPSCIVCICDRDSEGVTGSLTST